MSLHKQKQSEKFIDLKELSKLLLFNDTRSAIKWCQDKNIEVQTIGKKQVVNNFLVNIELDKNLIADLKKKHPKNWKAFFNCYIENDRLGYHDLIENNHSSAPLSIASYSKPKTKYARAFAES